MNLKVAKVCSKPTRYNFIMCLLTAQMTVLAACLLDYIIDKVYTRPFVRNPPSPVVLLDSLASIYSTATHPA